MRSRDTRFAIRSILIGLPALVLMLGPISEVAANPTYHDPAQDGTGFCASCHTRWPGRTDTHDLHVNPITGSCNLCHTGAGRNNPFMIWSVGTGDGTSNFGCGGCHGRDYGDTIELANGFNNGTAPFDLNGLSRVSGHGLRKQHLLRGVTDCIACHTDVPRSTVLPENVAPPYYARSDTDVSDPCLSNLGVGGEDSSPEFAPVVGMPGTDTPAEDAVGLDNDGDGRIDQDDPDCNPGLATTPGEALGMTASIDSGGLVTINYTTACSSTDHSVYAGPLTPADLQAGNYNQVFCQSDAGLTGSITFDPGSGSVFFIVAGEDAQNSGSFGESYFRDSASSDANLVAYPIHRERPTSASCGRPAPPAPADTRCD